MGGFRRGGSVASFAAPHAAWGGRHTRYADDLALSGERSLRTGTSRLLDLVAEAARDEGRVNERKTAVMPRGGRQVLGSLVVNDRRRVRRSEVDALRAVLHNCVPHGPSSQDREDFRGHLMGRVGWVAQHDPARGARLAAELARIDWTR